MTTKLPDWLSAPSEKVPQTRASKQYNLIIFEQAFPTVLDRLCEGYTLKKAVEEDGRNISLGAFHRWIKTSSERFREYNDALEVRSQVWADKSLEHALGEANPMEDVNRSKLIVDQYRWLIAADNRKKYGATQRVEVDATISVSSALEAARARLIESRTIDMIENKTGEQDDD